LKYHGHYRPESCTKLVTKYRHRAFMLRALWAAGITLQYIHRTVTEPVILSTTETQVVGRSGCLATRTFPSSGIEPATFRVPLTGPRSKTFSNVNRSRQDGCVARVVDAAAAVGVRMCECVRRYRALYKRNPFTVFTCAREPTVYAVHCIKKSPLFTPTFSVRYLLLTFRVRASGRPGQR